MFIKYGKPIEDDARTLIENKLTAVYQQKHLDATDDEIAFHRRMRAYGEIADRQLSEIVRSMMSYGDDRMSRRLTSAALQTNEEYLVTETDIISLGIVEKSDIHLSQVA